MSYGYCGNNNYSISKAAIYAELSRLTCVLSSVRKHKEQKYDLYKKIINSLSRYSVDPRGIYAAFLGLKDQDPTKILALFITDLRGEFQPNLNSASIYHVAYVFYLDMNSVPRAMRIGSTVVSGAASPISGANLIDGAIAQKVFSSQPNPELPIGFTEPLATGFNTALPGTPADILYGGPGAVGGGY